MGVMLANHLAADSANRALRRDVSHGLRQTPKSLPPKWFYDEVGSQLHDLGILTLDAVAAQQRLLRALPTEGLPAVWGIYRVACEA